MTNNGIYANRNSHGDFFRNALVQSATTPSNVYIAAAFFTDAQIVKDILAGGSVVNLVVRLGFPTSPRALEELAGNPSVKIRYFTSNGYHPKLYIFGDRIAFVGSANLTNSALLTNQEVVVSIDSQDDRFVELTALFGDYWDDANVLDAQAIQAYAKIYAQYDQMRDLADKLQKQVEAKFGDVAAKNIARQTVPKSKESLYLEDFRKTYQETINAFNVIRRVYEATGYRKAGRDSVPLRIEIDSFISYVRDKFTVGESWRTVPLRFGADQEQFIAEHIEAWKGVSWPHYEQEIVGQNYPTLLHAFSSEQSILSSTDDQLFDALSTLHSLYDRLRFFAGGLVTWKEVFLKANDPKRLREVLAYLVFGKGPIEVRMANVIHSSAYKLNQFGQSNVQELVGWLNNQDLPIINGRTTKILRYFGSEVRQLS